MGEPKLKRCPFCGGEAERKQNEFCGHQRTYIQCNSCYAVSCIQTEGMTVAFNGKPARYISIEECIDKAETSWNSRIREGYAVILGGQAIGR